MPSFMDALKKSSTNLTQTSFSGKRQARKEPSKPNPFNTKVTKPKFQILNRFERGATGNIVQSKTKAHAVRSATILPQLKEFKRAHTSTFVDRRFGERDKTLSREEVMQERFAREQQRLARKQSRKSKFDLNKLPDEEYEEGMDSEFALTHGGRSVSQMDDEELEDYDEYQLDDDENDDETVGIFGKKNARSGNLDKNLVSRGHFGGFEEEGGQPKSKQDIMKELMAKSKFHKHERQKVKEENEAMTEDLNTMFSEIRGNLQMLNEEDRRRLKETSFIGSSSVIAEEDDYESVLKDLTFDPRSRPTDRTLRPEEQARLEQERSEAKEKAMLSRMLPEEERKRTKGVENVDGNVGLDDSDSDEGNVDFSSAAPIDPELIKIAKRQAVLMRAFCKSSNQEEAQNHYAELVEYANKQPRTMIQLARALRSEIGRLSTDFTERCNKTGRGTFMPALSAHRLLLLVTRVFSCSDFHHVVATPAQLLIAYYLRVGRMTKLAHVQRALSLAYLATQFQEVGRRCIPEALEVLFTVLATCEAEPEALKAHSHYFRRPMSRSIFETFAAVEKVDEEVQFDPSLLLFTQEELSPAVLVKFAQHLTSQMFDLLQQGEYPALKEAIYPFTKLRFCPKNLHDVYLVACSGSSSLQLQNHKPLALPMLTPDFATDYSLDSHRRDRDETSELRAASRMKAAVRREYKGAVRELKRDAAFLAEHEIKERRAKDASYKARMNQIVGLIGNEGSNFKKSKK